MTTTTPTSIKTTTVSLQNMTSEEMLVYITAIKKEKEVAEAKLKEANSQVIIYMKVAIKGGVSVYGLSRRFPTTLYVNQWLHLFSFLKIDVPKAFSTFIEEHKEEIEENVATAKLSK